MPRGGHRENAGRKSGWEHPETTVIRVPQFLANQLLEVARKLDKGESLDLITESKDSNIELVTESESDLVIESIKHILGAWRVRADAVSLKNSDWRKVRQILSQLEPVVYEKIILESVTQSKVHLGQMNLLDNESVTKSFEPETEIVTDSDNSSVEFVTDSLSILNDSATDSEGWLTTKECWEQLGMLGSYRSFRNLSPEKLHRVYGVQADSQRKQKGSYKHLWLRLPGSNG